MSTKVEHIDGKWRKPVVVDDWGHLGYYLSAVKSAAGTWGHPEQDKTQRLEAGERVRVRWPTGPTSVETIVGVPYTRTVSDMGKPYEVSGKRLVIRTSARGVSVDVPLEDLWIQRAAVKEAPEGK